MHKFLFYTILISLLLSSCDTDIQILDPLADQPVVYCLLNQENPEQYLRVARSYMSFDGQKPPASGDSLIYFSKIEAQLERLEDGEVKEIYPFEAYQVEKDSGQFPTGPYWIYKTRHQVIPNTEYRLVAYIVDLDKIIYSTCKSLSRFSILDPVYPDVRTIHMLPDHNPVFRWTAAENAVIYQLGFVMNYKEVYLDSLVDKSLQISIRTSYQIQESSGYFNLPINSTQFYKHISEVLKVDPAIQRKFTSLDVVVQAGGEDLAYYIQQQENADPFRIFEFTNLINSEGVFSAISVERIDGFQLTNQSIDSLAYGSYTSELNFLDRYGSRKDQKP